MQNEDYNPEPKPESSGSMKPPRPPRGTVVGADDGGDDSGGSVKADYGCHEALWALSARYRESDIHGAHSALVEQEKLLRDHIGFPGYKAQLAFTMVMRSDIVSHLGDAQMASSIMAEAVSIMAGARHGKFISEVLLKCIRDLDEKSNVKWRKIDRAA
jgi:hypothetical protein